MFKSIVELFSKKNALVKNNEIVLVGTCFKSSEEAYLLFDEAEQAIEYAYYWYGKTERAFSLPLKNGGYFPVAKTNIIDIMRFSSQVSFLLKQNKLPVIISNSHDSFIECIAGYKNKNIGVVNINHRVDVVNGISIVPMQGYASILSENNEVKMLSLGVYENIHAETELNLAKIMGVKWVNSDSFYSINPRKTYDELDAFISRYDGITLNVDLRSIVRGMTTKAPFSLDLDLLLEVVSKCIKSKKLTLIHLTGDTDPLIFSREVKQVLDTIRTKPSDETYAT